MARIVLFGVDEPNKLTMGYGYFGTYDESVLTSLKYNEKIIEEMDFYFHYRTAYFFKNDDYVFEDIINRYMNMIIEHAEFIECSNGGFFEIFILRNNIWYKCMTDDMLLRKL